MTIVRVTLIASTLAFALCSPLSAAVAPRLDGTVGPEFTISLKKGGKRVTALARGRYTFVVVDRSTVHNFRLEGPGIARNLTSVGAVGRSKPVTLTLRPGKYRLYCVPHPLDMRGSFRVT